MLWSIFFDFFFLPACQRSGKEAEKSHSLLLLMNGCKSCQFATEGCKAAMPKTQGEALLHLCDEVLNTFPTMGARILVWPLKREQRSDLFSFPKAEYIP